MTDEELVKRLRSMHWCVTTQTNGVGVSDDTVAPEAADRIEELEAKLAKAVKMALEECPFREGTGSYNDWWHDRRTTLAEIESSEAVTLEGEKG